MNKYDDNRSAQGFLFRLGCFGGRSVGFQGHVLIVHFDEVDGEDVASVYNIMNSNCFPHLSTLLCLDFLFHDVLVAPVHGC